MYLSFYRSWARNMYLWRGPRHFPEPQCHERGTQSQNRAAVETRIPGAGSFKQSGCQAARENRGERLGAVQKTVVRSCVPNTEELGDRRWKEYVNLAPRKKDQRDRNHEQSLAPTPQCHNAGQAERL